ncbi:hypothetical protein ACFFRR_005771 [Megaselia abdita]
MHLTSKATLFLIPVLFSIVLSMPFLENDDNFEMENVPESDDLVYSKNGLGRRSLSIDPKYVVTRRIPPYNFGLGKRSKPVVFGLDKGLKYDPELFNLENLYEDLYQELKRSRPFSFGLGKREATMEEDRRAVPRNRYSFGLGKR